MRVHKAGGQHEMSTCIMRATRAPSATLRANTETQSRLRQACTTPVVEKRPTVGLIPTQPQKCPGTLPAKDQNCRLVRHSGYAATDRPSESTGVCWHA